MTAPADRGRRRVLGALPAIVLALRLPAASAEGGAPGPIWDLSVGRPVSSQELLQHLAPARWVLLGETHDNPLHHDIQSGLLQALAAGAPTTLAMEQFDTGRQEAIDGALARPDGTAAAVAEAGAFNRGGWNWDFYRPLVEVAVGRRLPLLAINLSRDDARRVAREGFTALGEGRSEALGIEAAWNHEREAALREGIVAGHCGEAPGDMLPRMVAAQRARDAIMADRLLAATTPRVVAILGREHARRDLGVPIHLARRGQGNVASVALVETDGDPAIVRPADIPGMTSAQFDFAWFTSTSAREDPCAELRRPAASR